MLSLQDNLIPLGKAARLLPFKPNPTTLWRWRTRGVRGHKLETVNIGGRVYTSLDALNEFVAAINASGGCTPPPVSKRREAELRRVDAELDRAGL